MSKAFQCDVCKNFSTDYPMTIVINPQVNKLRISYMNDIKEEEFYMSQTDKKEVCGNCYKKVCKLLKIK